MKLAAESLASLEPARFDSSPEVGPWRVAARLPSGVTILVARWGFVGEAGEHATGTFASISPRGADPQTPPGPNTLTRIAFDYRTSQHRTLEVHRLDERGLIYQSLGASRTPPFVWQPNTEPWSQLAQALQGLLTSAEVAWDEPASGGPEGLLDRLQAEPHRWIPLRSGAPRPAFLVRATLFRDPKGALHAQVLLPYLEAAWTSREEPCGADLTTFRIPLGGRGRTPLHQSLRGLDLRELYGFAWLEDPRRPQPAEADLLEDWMTPAVWAALGTLGP